MGWNAGYTIFESTVVGAYDLGKLDKAMLAVLMEPYRGTDIDSGGSCDLTSKDGKDVKQIVIETWGLKMPKRPLGKYNDDPDAWVTFRESVWKKFHAVTTHFEWH